MNDYEIETDEYLKHGVRIFQAHLFAPTEKDHVLIYNHYVKPNGVVVDMGSGIGEMGALLQKLSFIDVINITNSKRQHGLMNQMGRKNILTDYHTTTLPDSCADFVVFNETYGYGNPNILMKESARILKPNGTMVLKDFIYGKGFDQKKEHKGWDYFVYPLSKVLLLAEQSGLKVSWLFKPTVFYSRFVTFFAESRMKEWHQKVDFDVETVLIKFEKVGHG